MLNEPPRKLFLVKNETRVQCDKYTIYTPNKTLDDALLGEGAFSQVYRAQHVTNPDPRLIAIKKIRENLNYQEFEENYVLKTLWGCQSERNCIHIVNYVDYFVDQEGHIYLAMEFCEGGDLKSQITEKKTNHQTFPFELIKKWAKEILNGLEFLHANNIIHLNIKPANILVQNNQNGEQILKIGGFSSAVELKPSVNRTNSRTSAVCGINHIPQSYSPTYMSPEIAAKIANTNCELAKAPISSKTDIWSAGVVIFELIMLRWPFPQPIVEVHYAIMNQAPELDQNTPEEFRNLVNIMLTKNPTERPTAKDLIIIIVSSPSPPLTGPVTDSTVMQSLNANVDYIQLILRLLILVFQLLTCLMMQHIYFEGSNPSKYENPYHRISLYVISSILLFILISEIAMIVSIGFKRINDKWLYFPVVSNMALDFIWILVFIFWVIPFLNLSETEKYYLNLRYLNSLIAIGFSAVAIEIIAFIFNGYRVYLFYRKPARGVSV